MNYQETLQYINNTPKFSKILGNDDLLRLLENLGNPQDSLDFIHIAGTNGKGSVCAMTASVLKKAGYKVGLYTSPFIEEFNERMQINGENIPDIDLAEIATQVKTAIDSLGIEISVFAQITAMAFLYFAREKCDIVILETGMGGRLDATNVIKNPKAVVITKIGLDHTEWLGETIAEITAEKCGIIKEKVPVFTSKNQTDEALSVIEKYSEKNNSSLFICDESALSTSLSGNYQRENAGIAFELLKNLGIDDEIIKDGFLNTKWIARFEFLRDNLIIDGAHNPDGMEALAKSLKALNKTIIFVIAMMEDKNIEDAISYIKDLSDTFIVTQLDMPRCMPAKKLADYFTNADICKNPTDAVNLALSGCEKDQVVCVCGSLYLAGEVRKHFK